jgi:error-prone DNA polymerase
MMAALQDALSLLKGTGVDVDLAHLPADDPKVYAMLQGADTVGVFQVESRAQMATLPRVKPTHFYDLVVEVAIIRPGPIVGNMVHPYLARRAGREAVTYAHPRLEPILSRTLGVPLFQEQLLRMAMAVANFTGGEAEDLRRAMGMKRSQKRMAVLEVKMRAGMKANGIEGAAADQIVQSITSFALYGFPESHAASFALLAYASAYLRAHYPAAFVCALLNNQPMGFYSPFTLVKDAQRHGARFRPVDVTRSEWLCTLEDGDVRLGLRYVRGLRQAAGESIVAARRSRPLVSVQDLVDRADVHRDELPRLAETGALNAFGLTRRSALWQVEKAGRPRGELFRQADEAWIAQRTETETETVTEKIEHDTTDGDVSPLADMSLSERLHTDIVGTGLTMGPHPMALHREGLASRGIQRAWDLSRLREGTPVRVAGAVICRQRPGTAKGFVFLTLEDETGLVNITVRPDLFESHGQVVVTSEVLEVDGILQTQGGVSVRATDVRRPALPQLRTSTRHIHYPHGGEPVTSRLARARPSAHSRPRAVWPATHRAPTAPDRRPCRPRSTSR